MNALNKIVNKPCGVVTVLRGRQVIYDGIMCVVMENNSDTRIKIVHKHGKKLEKWPDIFHVLHDYSCMFNASLCY